MLVNFKLVAAVSDIAKNTTKIKKQYKLKTNIPNILF